MKYFSILFSTFLTTIYLTTSVESNSRRIIELANRLGYELEEHQVPTEDGYILTMHKIPRRGLTRGRESVFLMHGLVDSSDCWLLQGSGKSIAFLLADEGYDVWVGNARGNKYSTDHYKLHPADQQFWRFTWEQIGYYDLPAMIDYALSMSTKGSLYYVGHSQGTTSFYVMTSMKPEYNRKIKMMFSLSPVAYWGNVKSPLVRLYAPMRNLVLQLVTKLNIYFVDGDLFRKLISFVCAIIPCDNMISKLVGEDNHLIKPELFPVIFSHFPTSASYGQFHHYAQLVESGRFCRFDYNKASNIQIYKSEYPPDYNLKNVVTPVVLFYSDNDYLADTVDVNMLATQLPNAQKVFMPKYNHIDFIYADSAHYEIYAKIFQYMDMYERRTPFNATQKLLYNFTLPPSSKR